jgi:hypothetical protein
MQYAAMLEATQIGFPQRMLAYETWFCTYLRRVFLAVWEFCTQDTLKK